jgi:hypothetical protein
MMDKKRKNRMVSIQMLELPWFEVDVVEQDILPGMEFARDALEAPAEDALPIEPRAASRMERVRPEPLKTPHTVTGDSAKLASAQAVARDSRQESAMVGDVRAGNEMVVDGRKGSLRVSAPIANSRTVVSAAPAAQDDPNLIAAVKSAITQFKCRLELRYSNSRQAFLALNTERTGALSPAKLAMGMSNNGIRLSPLENDLAWSIFDPSGRGKITYKDFFAILNHN